MQVTEKHHPQRKHATGRKVHYPEPPDHTACPYALKQNTYIKKVAKHLSLSPSAYNQLFISGLHFIHGDRCSEIGPKSDTIIGFLIIKTVIFHPFFAWSAVFIRLSVRQKILLPSESRLFPVVSKSVHVLPAQPGGRLGQSVTNEPRTCRLIRILPVGIPSERRP